MNLRILAILGVAFLSGACAHNAGPKPVQLGFETRKDMKLYPADWTLTSTNIEGQMPTWKVEPDGEGSALNVHPAPDAARRTYNLAWTNRWAFRDGAISVRVRANCGTIDQGGGPIWRVQDASNYYLARYNPLETNLRVYHVVAGKRTQLADAPDIKIPAGQWFQIDVNHVGSKITVSLDRKQYLAVEDNALSQAGGVGLWSKADAASSFDDLKVQFAAGT